MASSIEARRSGPGDGDVLERGAAWIRRHRQPATYVGVALVIGALLFVWNMWSGRQASAQASEQLQEARLAFESGNLSLASSELSRLVENYSGTRAAEEATLLLAQVRLQQGGTAQAVDLLSRFAPGASSAYRSKAYDVLGAAYEDAGRLREAAEAHEEAARHARVPVLGAQSLSEAARIWAAVGDTAKAVAIYQRIAKEFEKEGASREAEVRLGELTRGGLPSR